MVTPRWSYIVSEKYDREELYDLESDPAERNDLAKDRPQVREEMNRLLAGEIRRGRLHPYATEIGEAARVELSEEVERPLRSLGYVD